MPSPFPESRRSRHLQFTCFPGRTSQTLGAAHPALSKSLKLRLLLPRMGALGIACIPFLWLPWLDQHRGRAAEPQGARIWDLETRVPRSKPSIPSSKSPAGTVLGGWQVLPCDSQPSVFQVEDKLWFCRVSGPGRQCLTVLLSADDHRQALGPWPHLCVCAAAVIQYSVHFSRASRRI